MLSRLEKIADGPPKTPSELMGHFGMLKFTEVLDPLIERELSKEQDIEAEIQQNQATLIWKAYHQEAK